MELGQTLAPISISLLLRLDRPDLASLLWAAPEEPIPFLGVVGHEGDEDLWLSTAATGWFAMAYRRLVRAFERANDREAADVAESILVWRSRVPAEGRRQNASAPKPPPDISFLDPVSRLLSDSQRRLGSPPPPKIDLEAIAKGKGDPTGFLRQQQPARIAALIGRLEDVRGAKMVFPGPLVFSLDPVCDLLKREGEHAVDALLDAYENDQRLTRTFDYSRPWSTKYTPIAVHDVIEVLLSDILGDKSLIQNSTPGELRTWWRQHQSSNRALRSLEVLADDRADPTRWLESATYLTMRSAVEWADGQRMSACDSRKPAPALFGESVRSKQPALQELLAKRTTALVDANSDLACGIAVASALWDPSTALPVLRTAARLNSCKADSLVTVARLSLDDSSAAADWAGELRNRPSVPPLLLQDLYPLWMFPNDPTLRQTADWLFDRPESPWSPALEYEYVDSPLLTVPSYRRAVMSALNNEQTIGVATRSPEGLLSCRLDSGGGGGTTKPGNDPGEVPFGQERPVRVKDLVAWELANLEGAPQFELDWPEADKDAAISELAAFLTTHSSELRAFPARLQDTNCVGEQLYLGRPPLR